MMKLYYHPVSFPSLAPLFAAEAMGIEYEKNIVDLSAGEQKSDRYLAVNPFGKIPALSDGDFSIGESNAILRYLALRENSPLYSGDLHQQSRIDQWMDFIVHHIRRNVIKIHFNKVLASMFGQDGNPDSIEQGEGGLKQHLPHVETQLQKTKYICGDEMSLADIVLLASLEPVEMAKIDLSDFPAIPTFLTEMRQQKFYTNVHSHYGVEIENSL